VVRVASSVLTVVLLSALGTGCEAGPDRDSSLGSAFSTATPSNGDGSEPFQPTGADRAAIRALLAKRARALMDGDRAAFLATIDTEDGTFVRQQEALFANLQLLPVESVRYSVDDGAGYPTAKVPGDDPLFRPAVLEQVRLDVDEAPVTNTLEDTFVRRDDAWLLGAESVPGRYRDDREPQSRPWAGTVPIAVARSGRLLIVVDGRLRGEAQGLADQLAEDIRFDAQALGTAPSYDVLVDATTVGETHAMSTVGDTDAAAVTFSVTYYDNGGDGRLAGTRVKVNPETAAETIADTQVMRHELTHFLTLRRLTGAPTWVKEGLAEWVSTAPSGLDDLVVDSDAYAHVTKVERRLPTQGRWGLDPSADYLIARAAVTHLVETYGVAEVLALAQIYRTIPGDDADEKTDRVLRRALGISEAQLVTATWDELGTLHRG
jgi:hypothetical protein